MISKTVETVTWVRVEKPTLDLVGLVLGSLSLAGLLAVLAFACGSLFGFFLIRRTRRGEDIDARPLSLGLGALPPPP